MQNDPVVSKAAELFRLDLMPSPSDIKADMVRDIISGSRNLS